MLAGEDGAIGTDWGSTLALPWGLSEGLRLTPAPSLWHTILSAWNSFPTKSWPCEPCVSLRANPVSVLLAGASPSPGCSLTKLFAFSVDSHSAIVFPCLFGSRSTLLLSICMFSSGEDRRAALLASTSHNSHQKVDGWVASTSHRQSPPASLSPVVDQEACHQPPGIQSPRC